ncbi:MFS transporter [Chryseobacterium jejuense]|uniref:Fucose permease n=1 Tax=Chryseobacterium jejuense TaxID=445960 RepID=A0A2X2XFJ4_CHRJE|nr:MFS transporter [Chryseobacterium jejuense]SDI24218.1 Fucose permease [Chryseobacterium jejuense]SQB46815.1 Glucose/mannose:H(+) symporter [Chryseobacterium jejuense]
MDSKKIIIIVVFLLAFLTGVNFVIFPALGNAFMDSSLFALSISQFGNLFVPQVICIIISCLSAPFLVNKWGPKVILAVGILLMLASTGTLWFLHYFMSGKSLLFPILLILVACMGMGFGFSITTLNPLAASLFEKGNSSAILILQFLVGLGTSTSPLMMNLIGDVKNWMYVPGVIFIVVSLVFILFLLLKIDKGTFFELPDHFKIPKKLWIFFAAIILYGCVEGTFGSFGGIILKNKGLDNSNASFGLSLFWGGIALNRLLFGMLSKKLELSLFFITSPLWVGILLLLLLIYPNIQILLMMMFLIGFFMGSIFPGSIGWGTVEFPTYSVLVSGFLMAANQIGTGIVTNVLGHFSNYISTIIGLLIILMLLICVLFFYLKKGSKIKEAF